MNTTVKRKLLITILESKINNILAEQQIWAEIVQNQRSRLNNNFVRNLTTCWNFQTTSFVSAKSSPLYTYPASRVASIFPR